MRIATLTKFEVILLILLAIATGISIWLLGFMEANLHCDQYSSFQIAILDFVPHPEEGFEINLPLIYSKPSGYFIRMYFLILDIAALIVFPMVIFSRIIRSKGNKSLMAIWLLLLSTAWVNALIPETIQGERMQFISQVCAFYFTSLSPLIFACIKLLPKNENKGDGIPIIVGQI